MARPRVKELTPRELEVMHAIWDCAPPQSDATPSAAPHSVVTQTAGSVIEGAAAGITVAQVRDELARRGRDLAYTTVATLMKILTDKEFLAQTTDARPFSYAPARSFEDVSSSLLGDLVERVFCGSREQLLVRLVEDRKLTRRERAVLEQMLDDAANPPATPSRKGRS